jgi:hypothetical protein
MQRDDSIGKVLGESVSWEVISGHTEERSVDIMWQLSGKPRRHDASKSKSEVGMVCSGRA